MKKFLWIFLLFVAVGSLAYFVGYPYYLSSVAVKDKEETTFSLQSLDGVDVEISKEGWTKEEKFTYTARDIPSVEQDFYALGYPPFLYASDSNGDIDKSVETSHHENGMVATLGMDNKYFVKSGQIEYTVPQDRFNSTAMDKNIAPLCDFVRIITGRAVSEEDRSSLLREFALVFNEKNEKDRTTHTIKINDLDFTLGLDRFYLSILLSF